LHFTGGHGIIARILWLPLGWVARESRTSDTDVRPGDTLQAQGKQRGYCIYSRCIHGRCCSNRVPLQVYQGGKYSRGVRRSFSTTRRAAFLTKIPYEDAGRDIWITFDERIDNNKLVFNAHTSESEKAKVVVKFADRYSADAHRALAEHGAAPRLRGCFPAAGGWLVVVMEESEYERLFEVATELTPAKRAKVQTRVKEIVSTLHGRRFVHGDIRSTNLLVDRASLDGPASEVKIHVIDYDWAGLDGSAMYPIGINRSSVKRPDGAEGGELIAKAHDLDMISYLFQE